ncbi:MAG: NAD-glutamate dehydrogenase [Actinomycetales bacterium]
MLSKAQETADAALDALLQKAVKATGSQAAATAGIESPPDLLGFVHHYYRHVPADDLEAREPLDVAGAALAHRRLAEQRLPGTAKVRALNPSGEDDGWSSPSTVVEVVTDDMPFLVDSTVAELTRLGHPIQLVVHPQLAVSRDVAGQLLQVGGVDSPEETAAGHQTLHESWMHIEVDRVGGDDELHAIETALEDVLQDVREAVEDWPKMRDRARQTAADLASTPPPGISEGEVSEARALLEWLASDHFTFLGCRDYRLETVDGEDRLATVPGTGLGILRADQEQSGSFASLPPAVRARARERQVLVITKANSRSTVHRPSYLDYVGVKLFSADGEVVGERRFLGLLTSTVYTESIQRIPVVRRKVEQVLEVSGYAPDSHSGKDLLELLETFPRDELLQISVPDLAATSGAVLRLQERRQLRLFLRRDEYGRFMSCLVYLPRDRYTTEVRERMMAILKVAFAAASVDYTARVTESVLARLHFVVRVAPGDPLPEVDPAALEASLAAATRSWSDDFVDAVGSVCGEDAPLSRRQALAEAFPEAYKEDFTPERGVSDLGRVLALPSEDAIDLQLYRREDDEVVTTCRLKLYRRSPISLTAVLPVLQHMGAEVVDERPYALEFEDGRAFVYDFGLKVAARPDLGSSDDRTVAPLLVDAFEAIWSGLAEDDGFNALVVAGGLPWRDVAVLRAYAKYLRQAGTPFSQDYVESCLRDNVDIVRLLVTLFHERFDPDLPLSLDERQAATSRRTDEIGAALDAVSSLDQDRILRSLLALITATLRTNVFQRDAGGDPKPYFSFKLDPRSVPDLPAPRPLYEIWVYSPRVEGVHLRFGAVARGGLRWSDRREDFRTEILGLVKAQTVKNAVIVPTGAKGGFVLKSPVSPAVDRDAWLAEGVACYRTFISGLLDITDNRVTTESGQHVVTPDRVVRHDGDDSYLVVAADKGTATFSDIANEVAISYGFWLGDAFASGGSAGYDHKAMGITARGAWESVKRHFRELGVDTQSEDFTVVGIGDMSGDVFGNGMLLSEHIRLVAAFDHRHIFLDPNPDAAVSYAERRRLFDLPRSSWADYDTSLISSGGGVYPRTAKSVPISAEVRAALGLAEDVQRLTPAELMRAILTAPVDLFWNGGIGTYVKASTETNGEVGDKANDAIRVNGRDLRVKVVGEGGNLGFTQLGRIEYAQQGGRINTDAIDNSAGVDTSDHEVNIKILLDGLVASGRLPAEERNPLLASMTDEVAALVLEDNYEQNVLLGNARVQSHSMLPVHQRFMRQLEARGELDRALEFLPSDAAIEARHASGNGLTSPEFSVLVAYAKLTLKAALLEAGFPDQPWYERALHGYFPDEVSERFPDALTQHPLSREIVTTCVVNDMVNRGGITFVFRAQEEAGASAVEVTNAYTVAREVFALEPLWADVAALDTQVSTTVQTRLYLEARRLLDRATRWLLQARPTGIDVTAEVDRFGPELASLMPRVPQLLRGHEREIWETGVRDQVDSGAPQALAERSQTLLYAFPLLDVVEIALRTGVPAEQVARVYFAVSEAFSVDTLLTRITALPRDDRWQSLARSALRYDLYAATTTLTASVVSEAGEPASSDEAADAALAGWLDRHRGGIERARGTLEEAAAAESADLAALSVTLRAFRTLVSAGQSPTTAGER